MAFAHEHVCLWATPMTDFLFFCKIYFLMLTFITWADLRFVNSYPPPLIRFLVDNLKGSQFAKMWISFSRLLFLSSPSLPDFSFVCPPSNYLAVKVRAGGEADRSSNMGRGQCWALQGGFREVCGADLAAGLVFEIHLNRFQIPLILH